MSYDYSYMQLFILKEFTVAELTAINQFQISITKPILEGDGVCYSPSSGLKLYVFYLKKGNSLCVCFRN